MTVNSMETEAKKMLPLVIAERDRLLAELAQVRADAKAAVAVAIEDAAKICEPTQPLPAKKPTMADDPMGLFAYEVSEMALQDAAEIRALAPEDAIAEVARMRQAVEFQTEQRAQAMLRRNMDAPEDPHVEAVCERYGYGAVMDAASRLWTRKDSMWAFYIGGCVGMKTDGEARAALAQPSTEAKP